MKKTPDYGEWLIEQGLNTGEKIYVTGPKLLGIQNEPADYRAVIFSCCPENENEPLMGILWTRQTINEIKYIHSLDAGQIIEIECVLPFIKEDNGERYYPMTGVLKTTDEAKEGSK